MRATLLPAAGYPEALREKVLYGFRDSTIVFSTDGWRTTRDMATIYGGGLPLALHAMESSPLLACMSMRLDLTNGKIFRISRGAFSTFSQKWVNVDMVLECPANTYAVPWSIYSSGANVVVGPYGSLGSSRHVFLSTDSGVTFTNVWRIPYDTRGGIHLHAVAYDPADDSIWLAHGDDTSRVLRLDAPDYGMTFVDNELLGTGDGSTATFALQNGDVYREEAAFDEEGSIAPKVYVDDVLVDPEDYSVNYVSGSITFNEAPDNGKTVTCSYTYNSAVVISSNDQPTAMLVTDDYILWGQDQVGGNGVKRYNKSDGTVDYVLNLSGKYNAPIYTPFVTDEDGWVYTATRSTLTSVNPSVWRAQAPFDSWELVAEFDRRATGIRAIDHLAGVSSEGIIARIRPEWLDVDYRGFLVPR